jgi:response regulator RpfG family c-di-GMP phosphodiesterase
MNGPDDPTRLMPAPLNVLLVDDEPAVLRALGRLLSVDGHNVLKAEDPAVALELLGREKVDVVVADIDMPRMNGVELVAQIRRLYPAVVRILLTGRATLGSTIDAINEGEVFRYVTKPWDPVEMRATLCQAAARVEENHRVQRARSTAERQQRLLTGIEEAFPGLTTVSRVDDEYVIDSMSVGRGLAQFDSPHLLALWRGEPGRG